MSATAEIAPPDIAHYQRVLAGMIDRAAATAHSLADRIDAATPAETAPLSATFERVSMVVRRSILLSVHLARKPAPSASAIQATSSPAPADKAAAARAAARLRILRELSDTIAREGLPAAKAETLRAELVERLDAPDLAPELDREIATRPVADIILDLKRDMGLARLPGSPPWPRRTPDDIADLLARAHKPTQPWPTDPPAHLSG